ncbi:MAG: 3'(2'),5'-bisphosphate nucleotidase CysQ [Acidobacteriota bacterium]
MPDRSLDADFLEQVWRIAREAGLATLQHHRRDDLHVERKKDDSPVTAADLASQEKILAGLQELAPDIPWLAEEDARSPDAAGRGRRRMWLVDPLDGTKEFIAGRDEFTVNIALVDRGEPILGVVVAPALGRSYLGHVGRGAWRHEHATEVRRPIEAAGTAVDGGPGTLVVVASRSHRGAELEAFLEQLPPYEVTSIGSSLKLCLLAEGAADFYPRLSPTMEWDIAAAHAVLRAAGGEVHVYPDGETLRYDREDALNPYFIATCRRAVAWQPVVAAHG